MRFGFLANLVILVQNAAVGHLYAGIFFEDNAKPVAIVRTVYPYTKQQNQGVVIPFGDLLIDATVLSLGSSVLTTNLSHFQKIPGLSVEHL